MHSFTTSVIGSFPRPEWLKAAYDSYDRGEATERELQNLIDDATKLTIKEEELAGIDIVTDGEQERKSFVGIVGQKLPGFSLVPIEALNPNAKEILREKKTLLTYSRAVCTGNIRQADLVVEDFLRAKKFTQKAMKVSLPAPYLVMWEAWHAERSKEFYSDPVDMAHDYAKVARQNIIDLHAHGVDVVALDEPMMGDLTEAGEKPDRYHEALTTFYGQKYRGFKEEVLLAVDLLNDVTRGLPPELYVTCHMDRWPNSDSPHFNEGYERFLPELLDAKVKELDLEYNSPGCGDPKVLAKELSGAGIKLGLGCVSVTDERVESPEEIAGFVSQVVPIMGGDNVVLVPNCGFAPGMKKRFSREAAFAKLANMSKAAAILRERP